MQYTFKRNSIAYSSTPILHKMVWILLFCTAIYPSLHLFILNHYHLLSYLKSNSSLEKKRTIIVRIFQQPYSRSNCCRCFGWDSLVDVLLVWSFSAYGAYTIHIHSTHTNDTTTQNFRSIFFPRPFPCNNFSSSYFCGRFEIRALMERVPK